MTTIVIITLGLIFLISGMIFGLKSIKPINYNLVAGFVIVVGTIFGLFGKQLHEKKASEKTDSIKQTGEQTNEIVQNLKLQIATLSEELSPFKDIARKKYPNLSDEEALKKLEKNIFELEAKTRDLENKVKPRDLTSTQKDFLIQSLKSNPKPIFISSKMLDTESYHFAQQIAETLKKAGWGVLLSNAMTSIVDFKGVSVFSYPEATPFEGQNLLIEALNNAGIHTINSIVSRNKMGESPSTPCIVLIVGDK